MPTPLPFPWKERCDSVSPSVGSFSPSESQQTLVMDIDYRGALAPIPLYKIPGAILGYPVYNASPSPVWPLSRVLPMQHPICHRLYAAKIVSFKGRGGAASGNPEGTEPGDSPGVTFQTDPITGFGYAQYPFYEAVIQFAVPPFNIFSDAVVAPNGNAREFYRYVEKTCVLHNENIIKKGNQFRWAKVSPTSVDDLSGQGNRPPVQVFSGLPPGSSASDPLPIGQILRAGKANMRWIWHQVPSEALFGQDGTQVPPVLACEGTVNNAAFPGTNDFPAGTLLLDKVDFKPENAPAEVEMIGGTTGYPPRVYSVIYDVIYYNPATNPNWNNGQPYPYQGHNLVPANTPGAQPYFYLPTSDTVGNSPLAKYQLYPASDFTQLFRLPVGDDD